MIFLVFSNIGYILLGLFFIGTVRVRSLEGDDESLTSGLHLDMSLYYCLGWSLLMEGVFSGLYHVSIHSSHSKIHQNLEL